MKDCEVMMSKDGVETEVHVGSVGTMEAAGWEVVGGKKAVNKAVSEVAAASAPAVDAPVVTEAPVKVKGKKAAKAK